MAARLDTVTIKYKSDVTELTRDQRKVETQVKKAQKNADKLGNDLEKSYKKGSKGAKSFAKQTVKANQKVSVLDKSIKKIGIAVGAAFALSAISGFLKESVKLGAEIQGVRAGFEKLANSTALLEDLKIATRGTVTELELMKQAVRASNFQVPLNKLAQFFKFATQRALETGESVDFLVNSIIVGIGRKSALVLDNLGISAIRIQEETKKMGDFGAAASKIIAEELEKTGEVMDTNAVKIGRLGVRWEEFMTDLGDSDVLGNVADNLLFLIEVFETLSDRFVSASNVVLNEQQRASFRAAAAIKVRTVATEDLGRAISDATDDMLREIALLGEIIRLDLDGAFAKKLLIQQHEIFIQALENEVIARDKLAKAQAATIRNVFFLRAAIAAETKIINDEKVSIGLINEALASRILLENELKAVLEGRTLAEAEAEELAKKVAKEEKERLKEEADQLDELRKFVRDKQDAETEQREISEANRLAEEEGDREQTANAKAEAAKREEIAKAEADAKLAAASQLAVALADLGAALIKDQRKRALAQIAINAGVSIAELVKDTQQIGLTPVEKGILFAVGLAQIAAGIVTAKQQLDSFHEGEVDINPSKKNSKGEFAAKLIKGESVIKASRTKQYKEELESIQAGTLEHDMINKYLSSTLKGLGITTEKFNDNRMVDRMDRIIKKNNGTKEMIEAMNRNNRENRRHKNRMY